MEYFTAFNSILLVYLVVKSINKPQIAKITSKNTSIAKSIGITKSRG